MANNRFVLEGVIELQKALRDLPQALTDEARDILDNQAELTRHEIYSLYPRRTGNLREGVTLTYDNSQFSVSARIRNKAPHAYIFEVGTEARHTKLGADRGAMPAGRVFIPAMIRGRRAFWAAIRAMLTRHGLLVSGSERA